MAFCVRVFFFLLQFFQRQKESGVDWKANKKYHLEFLSVFFFCFPCSAPFYWTDTMKSSFYFSCFLGAGGLGITFLWCTRGCYGRLKVCDNRGKEISVLLSWKKDHEWQFSESKRFHNCNIQRNYFFDSLLNEVFQAKVKDAQKE